MTCFSQSPAEGIWDESGDVQKDLIVIYEIMANTIDKDWWAKLKKDLEADMEQEEIIIRWLEINVL